MRALNTLPIELFLEKYRIAVKSRQKSITLNMEEAGLLEESLAVVMARLAGELDTIALNMQQSSDISIKVDGGSL
jgi:hypothetical protein